MTMTLMRVRNKFLKEFMEDQINTCFYGLKILKKSRILGQFDPLYAL